MESQQSERLLRDHARTIFDVGIRSVQADRLLDRIDFDELARRPLASFRHIYLAGMGKASMAMASVIEQQLGALLTEGIAVVPEGYRETLPDFFVLPRRVTILEGGHPLPTEASVRAGRSILDMAAKAGQDDLLILLISGGGSALCTQFAGSISLDDARETYRLLLEGGANIREANTVRKHFSLIGGGRLAQTAYPASVLALVVSDVVGDDLSVIASGPVVPDESTFADAGEVIRRYGLWDQLPVAVRQHLQAGLSDGSLENPKVGSPVFDRVKVELIGTNRTALEAARQEAIRLGYTTLVTHEPVQGEAREVAKRLIRSVRDHKNEAPFCLLWGGETTVTIRGKGRGGRNQELALAAAIELEKETRPVVFLSGGTDGIDGPTPAAGAIATSTTVREARALGLDPLRYLEDNDAYAFFERLDSLVVTGPTHTNVMDLQICLVLPD